jgi:hypothetical protein
MKTKEVEKLKINYIKSSEPSTPEEDARLLAQFMSIFMQIGFEQLHKNPKYLESY